MTKFFTWQNLKAVLTIAKKFNAQFHKQLLSIEINKILKLCFLLMITKTVYAQTPNTAWYTANPNATTFTITTADQLAGLAEIVNATTGTFANQQFNGKTIILGNDIDLSTYGANYNNGEGWIPIGCHLNFYSFYGTFDGNGKNITGLYIRSNSSRYWLGLFGRVEGGTIKNLGVIDVDIAPTYYTYTYSGSVVGIINGGLITNCYSSGYVSSASSDGSSAVVGGVVGSTSGTVSNCYSTSTVKSNSIQGGSRAGGVVGVNDGGIVTNCYSIGSVNSYSIGGDSYAGGVVGRTHWTGGTVSNCYFIGSVSSTSNTNWAFAGGVVGENNSVVLNCYSTGTINSSTTGNLSAVGGVVGRCTHSTSNCAALKSSLSYMIIAIF